MRRNISTVVNASKRTRLAELQKSKDELTELTEALQVEIGELKDRITSANDRITKHEEEERNLKEKLNQANDEVQLKGSQLQREVRQREKAEIDHRQARAELQNREESIEFLKKNVEDKQSKIKIMEQSLEETTMALENTKKLLEELQIQSQKLCQENETFQRRVTRLAEENQRKVTELKLKEDECTKFVSENVKLIKLRDSLYVKIQKVQEQSSTANQQIEMQKRTLNVLEKAAEASKKQSNQQEKLIDELQREKAIINKNLIKNVGNNEKQAGLLKVYEQAKRNIDVEIVQLKEEVGKQLKVISQLEKERDRVQNENGELKSKVSKLLEDVRVKDAQIFDYHRKITDGETKLKMQQTAYDALKSERNTCSKNLSECQDEVTELKRRLKLSAHNLEHLKEDVNSKENALFHEQHDRQKLEKEKAALKFELEQTKNGINEWKLKVEKLEVNERKLVKQLTSLEEEKVKLKQQLEKIFNDKSSNMTQLIEKNKDICLLQENVKTLEMSANKKENEFHSLNDDIRLLKLEVKRLKTENALLERSTINFEDLQNKISCLEKELMNEKLKAKALEIELQNPHNIHRWRRLAGSEPTTFELTQKIRALQKRLIAKEEDSIEAKMRAMENKQLKMDSQREENQRSHSAMADKLMDFQQNLRNKDKLIKSLISEQDVYLSKMEACKKEIETLKVEVRDAKFKILMLRKSQKEEDTKIPARTTTAFQPAAVNSNKEGRKAISFGSGFRIMSAAVSNYR